jgi:hypothetical protein
MGTPSFGDLALQKAVIPQRPQRSNHGGKKKRSRPVVETDRNKIRPAMTEHESTSKGLGDIVFELEIFGCSSAVWARTRSFYGFLVAFGIHFQLTSYALWHASTRTITAAGDHRRGGQLQG